MMRYVRRGLLLVGLVGTAVAVVRRRRRPDPLAAADQEFASQTWTAPTAVVTPPAAAPVAEPVAEPEPVADPEPVPEPVAEAAAEPEPAHLAYLPHLQKYHDAPDPDALKGVVRHCGIALRNRDAAIVSAGDPVELKRIRESFLKKKLGLDLPDADLDAAIGDLMQTMTGDRAKSRATVYYLLADRFDKLDLFR